MSLEEWDALAAPSSEEPVKPMRLQAPPDETMKKSVTTAKEDFARFTKLKHKFEKAGKQYGVPVEVLAGIASRESRFGRALPPSGTGDQGDSFGIMQINKRFHKLRGTHAIDSQEHFNQAAEILQENKKLMDVRRPDWTEEQRWRGAVVSYNAGPDAVKDLKNMDEYTTGKDYSHDVLLRARALKEWSQ